MSDKIEQFFSTKRPATPCLVVDLDVVRQNYEAMQAAFPGTQIYYAVKANPHSHVLELLASLGACFDAASLREIEQTLAAGATPERISFGNSVKRESDIETAYALGIRQFVFDSAGELEKLARAAPGSDVTCRLAVDSAGAQWPLHRKFGCSAETARVLLLNATDLGLNPAGLSFHVGSQQLAIQRWDDAITRAAALFADLAGAGVALTHLNIGGGMPVAYRDDAPGISDLSETIHLALDRHFGATPPILSMEPGRTIVASAGIIETEVLLIAERELGQRWVYLDIGIYNGLTETAGDAIQYRVTSGRTGELIPAVLAGPTCDSNDVMYEEAGYMLPADLAVGDRLRILSTGAYTTTYASVGFNGFAPLTDYYI